MDRPTADMPPEPGYDWPLIAVIALGVGMLVIWFFGSTSRQYHAYTAKRQAWHQRCDAISTAGRAANPTAYDRCVTDWNALIEQATREGWTNRR